MSEARPMSDHARVMAYRAQRHGARVLTPRQRRRVDHKRNRAAKASQR